MFDRLDTNLDGSYTVANTLALLRLNGSGCKIKYTEGKGRGVYGARNIFSEKYAVDCHFV